MILERVRSGLRVELGVELKVLGVLGIGQGGFGSLLGGAGDTVEMMAFWRYAAL